MQAGTKATPGRLRRLLRRARRQAANTAGAQLLEFAFLVPMLLVALVGILDFGAGFYLKQKLTNAAREGARIATNQITIDLTSTDCPTTGAASPCTVEAVRNAVVNYLQNANVETSTIGVAPTKTGAMEWTYYSSSTGDPILVINRGFAVTDPGGNMIVSTRVALNYPFPWMFDRIMRLMIPSSTFSSPIVISSEAIMKNLG